MLRPDTCGSQKKKQKPLIFQFPINFWSVFFCICIYIYMLHPAAPSLVLSTHVFDWWLSRTDQRRKTFAVHIPYFALITPFLFGKNLYGFRYCVCFTRDFFCKICFKCLFHLSLGHGQVHSRSASIFLKLKFYGLVMPWFPTGVSLLNFPGEKL